MDEFFEKLKHGASEFKKGAAKVTKQVVRKTNDAVSQTKLSFAINETENKISEIYAEMGRSVYRDYLKNGEADEDMLESCRQIDKLLAEVDDLKEKVAELKQSVKCRKCGEFNKNGSSYCSKCGADLNAADTDSEAEEYVETEEETVTNRKIVTIRAKKPENSEE